MKKILSYVILVVIIFLIINSNVFASCASYTEKTECISNEYYSCIWNETEHGSYCSTDNLQYVQCANAYDIPHRVPELTSFAINFLKIVTPIILIITSIITLVKALMASKEDEIKKATGALKRKLIAAALVFFVIYIVQFVIMKVADSGDQDNISTCLSCFINNDCQENLYYKVADGSTYYCIYFNNPDETNRLCDYNVTGDDDIFFGENLSYSCSGGYFGGGNPDSILVDGVCRDLKKSGRYVVLDNNKTQNIWQIDSKYYYWNEGKETYVEIESYVNLITEVYYGTLLDACLVNGENVGYFKNNYQPKTIEIGGTCYKLEDTGKDFINTVNLRDGTVLEQSQSIWKANGKCYKWQGDQNKYIERSC